MAIAETDVQRRLEGVRHDARDGEVKRPRPVPWLGQRLLLLTFASGSSGYAFHFFGTWPLGIVAIAMPILGWMAVILAMQRQFGASNRVSTRLMDDEISNHEIAQMEADLAEQMDWRRRFGT